MSLNIFSNATEYIFRCDLTMILGLWKMRKSATVTASTTDRWQSRRCWSCFRRADSEPGVKQHKIYSFFFVV